MGETALPYARHWIDENDARAVAKALHGNFITQGPLVREFEEKIAAYTGAKHAVAVSNGTAALELAAKAANVKKGGTVITTPMTFVATPNAALLNQAEVAFADIEKETLNISPEATEATARQLSGKGTLQAIMPVHFGGQCCEMGQISKIAEENNAQVIEDACHALGAEYKGRKAGTIGNQGCFSFHPAKHITTGEGGMVTTSDEQTYKRLLLLRDNGINRDRKAVENIGYDVEELSRNNRISDISCALGKSQLDRLESFLKRRAEIARAYTEGLEGVPSITLPAEKKGTRHAWHLYCILSEKRNQLLKRLLSQKILANIHYIPAYRHSLYKKRYNISPKQFPNTEYAFSRILTLPLFPKMTDEDTDRVIKAVKEGSK